jgi:muramoyltetrapeptide carboxypeptidase
MFARTGLITFSGAMPSVDFADDIDSFSEASFWSALSEDIHDKIIQVDQSSVFKKGNAEGRLICGNLCLLATLCGSSFMPDFEDAILLIEDIGEEPYRIDRYLSQLELSGALHSIKGLLIGDFTPPTNPVASVPQRPFEDIISDYATRVNCPVLGTFPYGHIRRKLTLPFGIRISMNTDAGIIQFGESQFC